VIPRTVKLHDTRAIFLATTLTAYAFPSIAASLGVDAALISFAAPERIPWLQLAAMVSVVAFLFGYLLHGVPPIRSIKVAQMLRHMPKTPGALILSAVALMPLLVAVLDSGPQRVLGVAKYSRGHGQFEAKAWTAYASVIANMIGWPVSVLAAVGLRQHKRWPFLLVPLFVALLPMATFSRGLGIPLGLFVATWAVVKGDLTRGRRVAVLGRVVRSRAQRERPRDLGRRRHRRRTR